MIEAKGEWYDFEGHSFYINAKGIWEVAPFGAQWADNKFAFRKVDALPKGAQHCLMTNGGIWPILGNRIDNNYKRKRVRR